MVRDKQNQRHTAGIAAIKAGDGRLSSAGRDGTVVTWDLHLDSKTTLRPTIDRCFDHHTAGINDIALQDSKILTASSDRSIYLINQQNGVSALIGCHQDYVKRVCFASNNHAVSGGFDERINIWDLATATKVMSFSNESASNASIYALCCVPNGNLIASGSPDKLIRLWDSREATRSHTLVGHSDIVRDLIISHDGQYLLSASSDATVKLWSLSMMRCLKTYSHSEDSVFCLSSNSPTLDTFWSGSKDGWVFKVGREDNNCIAVCREISPVFQVLYTSPKITVTSDILFAATKSSNINCWVPTF